jgi:hypothetical protein
MDESLAHSEFSSDIYSSSNDHPFHHRYLDVKSLLMGETSSNFIIRQCLVLHSIMLLHTEIFPYESKPQLPANAVQNSCIVSTDVLFDPELSSKQRHPSV